MAQNVIINGVTYQNVPEVNIPKSGGGTAKFMDTDDANATASDMLSGKTSYVGGTKITGNISSKAAASYEPSTADQTISASQYLSGAQTVKAVVVSGLTASVVANGVTVKIGSASDDDCVMSLTGSLSAAVISQDSTSKILSIS
ncbi:MAG: hypothetical protein J6S60_04060 [Oscillospiraceae bacterium]|nr:hypothetical protein [Oscillospiraceae bacterium]